MQPKRHQSSKKPNTETPSKPAEPNTSQILPPRLLPGKLKLLNGRLLLKRPSKKRPSVLSQRATVGKSNNVMKILKPIETIEFVNALSI